MQNTLTLHMNIISVSLLTLFTQYNYYDRKIERAQRDNFEVSEVILKRYGQIILLLFWSKVHENLHISTIIKKKILVFDEGKKIAYIK